jgi:hypothetical protein
LSITSKFSFSGLGEASASRVRSRDRDGPMHGNREAERRSAIRILLGPQPAAMRFDNCTADGEADTVPVAFVV